MLVNTLRQWLRHPFRPRRVRRLSVRRPSTRLHVERCEDRVTPSAGALDTSFGVGGKATTNFFGVWSGMDSGKAVVVQPDQKIVVAGPSDANGKFDFALARYNPNGTLDSTFGKSGLVLTDFAGLEDYASSMVLQNDGKIVVGGYSNSGSGVTLALARYNADGTLDGTFGTGGKVVSTPTGATYSQANSLALTADGRLYAGGFATVGNDDFAVARFLSDGTLDSSFGAGGWTRAGFAATGVDQANAVALQYDGKVVLAGFTIQSSNNDFCVMRFNTDGTLDTTFGGTGKVKYGQTSATFDIAQSLAIQGDGRFVLAGYSGLAPGPYDFSLMRLNNDGTLDPTFGTGGLVRTDVGTVSNDVARAVVVQADGKIAVAGYSQANGQTNNFNFALLRYNTNGTLDSAFGVAGKTVTDFSKRNDLAIGLAMQLDGKYVVAGSANILGNADDFAVARFDGDFVAVPPTANAGGPYSVAEGAAVMLDGGASKVGLPTGPLQYVWDLDGDNVFGETGAAAGNGDELGATPTFSAATLDGPTQVTVQLRVTNTAGLSDTTSALISVTNVAPTADAGSDLDLNEGDSVTLSATFSDPGAADTLTFAWSVVDSNGNVVASGDSPSLSFTPADNGTYTATVTATDDDGGVGSDSLVMTVHNVPPTADAGPDLTCDEGSLVTFHGDVADLGNSDTHTFAWTVTDAAGNVVAQSNSQDLTFTPADNGVYTATLTVTDDDGGVGTDSATLTVGNVTPTADAGVDQIGDEGSPITLHGAFADPGSADTHTFEWTVTDAAGNVVAHGTSQDLTFTPLDNGVYTATFTVTDDDGGVGADTAVLSVRNVAPTAAISGFTQPTAAFVLPGQTLTFGGLFNDAGVLDGHTVTWSFGDGTSSTTGLSPSGAASFTAKHTFAAAGTYTVTLKVTDKDGGESTAQVSVVVKSAQAALGDLIAAVQKLTQLNQGERNALTSTLDAAVKSLNKGNNNAASNQVAAFINKVKAKQQSGQLTSEQAQSLTDMAYAIIAAID